VGVDVSVFFFFSPSTKATKQTELAWKEIWTHG